MIKNGCSVLIVAILMSIVLINCGGEEEDNVAPDVTITTPLNGQVLNSIHTIKCTAEDNKGVVAVNFIIDDKMVDPLSESRTVFYYQWNTTALEDSSRHIIYVQAFDASDNIGLSDTVICYVDNRGVAPVAVELAEPQNIGKHNITLSWTPSIDKDFKEYRLYRNTSDSWNGFEKLVKKISQPGQSAYNDNGYNADTTWVTRWGLDENRYYYYRLQVADTAGLVSNSNVVYALTKLPEPVVLRDTYTSTKLSATIQWYKSSEDVKYYRIHRNRVATVGSSLSDSVGMVSSSKNSYTDSGLSSLTAYYYKVFIVDEAGYASGSNVISVETGRIGNISLNTPVGEEVKKHSVQLSWSRSQEEDDCEYRLYRSMDSGVDENDVLVTTVTDMDNTTYTDSGLEENRMYYYKVYLVDSEGNSAKSNEIEVKTLRLQARSLTVKSVEKYHATIGWDKYTDNDFAGYFFYRSDHDNFDTSAAQIKSTLHDPNTIEYIDEDLNIETQYYYQLFIADTFGSKAGSSISLQTKGVEQVEIKEINAIDDSYFQLVYSMNREDDDFAYYSIHRAENSNVNRSDLQVGTRDSRTDTTFNDPVPATLNTQYYYRVYVVDSRNNVSPGSNVMGDTLNSAPDSVELSFVNSTNTSIQLQWSLNENDDFSVYMLYRSINSEFTKSSKNVVRVATITNRNTTTYTESNLPSGALYYYRIYVVDVGGLSAASNIVRAYTVP